jgi:gas vesicle protein
MRNAGKTVKDWVRLAAKVGVVLTDPKVRAAISDQMRDQMKERLDSATDTVTDKYEQAVDRLEAAGSALQGKSYWPSPTLGFLLGVGVGGVLGVLLAPAAGSETREVIRGKAVDLKDRMVESASTATGKVRESVSRMPPTGTEG